MRLWPTLAAAAVLAASPAGAQEIRAPLLELGGNVSVLVPILIEDGPIAVFGAGPRVTVNITRRIGFELFSEALGPIDNSGVTALYVAQVKLPLRHSRGGARTWSFTGGVGGGIWYHRVRESRMTRPDGSIVVHPGYREIRAHSPNTITLGLTRDQVLGRSIAGSFGAQLFGGAFAGIGIRAAAGISFGPGGYR